MVPGRDSLNHECGAAVGDRATKRTLPMWTLLPPRIQMPRSCSIVCLSLYVMICLCPIMAGSDPAAVKESQRSQRNKKCGGGLGDGGDAGLFEDPLVELVQVCRATEGTIFGIQTR